MPVTNKICVPSHLIYVSERHFNQDQFKLHQTEPSIRHVGTMSLFDDRWMLQSRLALWSNYAEK